ncbi:hypothetical protein SOVF_114110 [Spinacia oleracea]|nr:hypothetical protein SOVF_114110 [Spinacia oleracea]
MAKDSKQAIDWVKKNVQSYLPDTNIIYILIENEVLALNDTTLTTSLLPGMQSIRFGSQCVGNYCTQSPCHRRIVSVVGR